MTHVQCTWFSCSLSWELKCPYEVDGLHSQRGHLKCSKRYNHSTMCCYLTVPYTYCWNNDTFNSSLCDFNGSIPFNNQMQSNELKIAFSGSAGEVLWIKCVWDTRENETELVCFGCEGKLLLRCVFLGFVVGMVCSTILYVPPSDSRVTTGRPGAELK